MHKAVVCIASGAVSGSRALAELPLALSQPYCDILIHVPAIQSHLTQQKPQSCVWATQPGKHVPVSPPVLLQVPIFDPVLLPAECFEATVKACPTVLMALKPVKASQA